MLSRLVAVELAGLQALDEIGGQGKLGLPLPGRRSRGVPEGRIEFVVPRVIEGQFVDLGMYMQNFMLLARERGLHTCAQEAWSQMYATTRRVLRIPEDEMIFCGLALGYADDAAAEGPPPRA